MPLTEDDDLLQVIACTFDDKAPQLADDMSNYAGKVIMSSGAG
jgi:hypothetical protein